jgi:ribosomal protein S18 acetylase RimI-like enzyme
MNARIVPLAAAHRRDDFDCGDEALNDFLRRYARQQQERDFSRTYVVLADDDVTVRAFVSVSVGQVGTTSLPGNLKLPRYPVPVLRIGRLAVDRRAQGSRLGRELTRFALSLSLELASRVGLYAFVVDAKNEAAVAFYQRLGFVRFRDAALSLHLPIATVRQASRT